MQHAALADISQPQQERLAFIEFRLMFLGSANRPDLARRFGVSESAASRDFALYRQLAPSNLHYDRSSALYIPAPDLAPVFHYSASQVLTALAEGFGDDFVATPRSWLPCELPSRLNAPAIDVLIPVARALFNGNPLQMDYRSLASGLTHKTIVPLVLVDNGLRWHLRAYEPEQQRYADFVLNRMDQVQVLAGRTDQSELRQADQTWQQMLRLEIKPHPQLRHPDTVAHEYAMRDGSLSLEVRAALAGYLLRRWNVDCTPDHCLQGPEYLLWLSNAAQLQSQSALTIAPGFMDVSQHRHTEAMDAEA
tara:strand:- start:17350 stop:18270 length:921 start_codon:yes stop_codon:yes gene_type:complete